MHVTASYDVLIYVLVELELVRTLPSWYSDLSWAGRMELCKKLKYYLKK